MTRRERSQANSSATAQRPTTVHDADGNVLSIVNLAPNGSIQSSYVYTYNDVNLPVTMTTAAGTYSYGYDADGQLTSVESRTARSPHMNTMQRATGSPRSRRHDHSIHDQRPE